MTDELFNFAANLSRSEAQRAKSKKRDKAKRYCAVCGEEVWTLYWVIGYGLVCEECNNRYALDGGINGE